MARFWPDDNPLSVGDFKTGSSRMIAQTNFIAGARVL